MTWDDYLDLIDDYVPVEDLERIETPDDLIRLNWMQETRNNGFRKGLQEFRNRNETQFEREVSSLIADKAGGKRLSEAQGILEGLEFLGNGIAPSDLELAKKAFPEVFRGKITNSVLKGRLTRFDQKISGIEGRRNFALSNRESVLIQKTAKQDAQSRRNPKKYLQDHYYLTEDEADALLQ